MLGAREPVEECSPSEGDARDHWGARGIPHAPEHGSNPGVSPDGRWAAIQLGNHGMGAGQGRGIVLVDLAARETECSRSRQLRSFLNSSRLAPSDSSGGTPSFSYSMMYHSMPPTVSAAVMIAGQSSSSAPR